MTSREAITKRTREALAVAKARGTKLGNPNGAAAIRRAAKGDGASQDAIKANANAFATALAPIVDRLQSGGLTISLSGSAPN